MWQNYLKIALRNISKQKVISSINVFGLSLGMACFFVIWLYVRYEMNYDRFHSNGNRLYRVTYHANFVNEAEFAAIPAPIAPLMKDYFPEIEAVTRMYRRGVSIRKFEDRQAIEVEDAFFADTTLLDVFDFEGIEGLNANSLHEPGAIILSEKLAKSLFGHVDIIGERLQLGEEADFFVSAVVKDWPNQSHINFQLFARYEDMYLLEPQSSREKVKKVVTNNWVASHSYTYVLLRENGKADKVNDKFPAFLNEFGNERLSKQQAFTLFPVKDIHLRSEANMEIKSVANITYLYLFLAIGLITLLIACMNFINLSTASSISRAREVGVRKVLGADKKKVIQQFLGESIILSFFAWLLACLLAVILIPFINELIDITLSLNPLLHFNSWMVFLAVSLVAGILAGSYPAFIVSRFQPVTIFKSSLGLSPHPGGTNMRNVLITVQFLLSVVLISGAAIVYLQFNFLRNRPMGFLQEQILSVSVQSNNMNSAFRPGDSKLRKKMNLFDEIILEHPRIQAVTQCSNLPGMGGIHRQIWSDHVSREENLFLPIMAVDYDFVETFKLRLIEGRDFDLSFGMDHTQSFVINEHAVKELGFQYPKQAIGGMVNLEGKKGKIVGVVENFHFETLRHDMQGLILEVNPGVFSYFAISLDAKEIPTTIKYIKSKWQKLFPEKTFEYKFLDDSLDEMYASERRLSRVIGIFAAVAIILSCIGLLGLAAIVTQRRLREISIRKVLGASSESLLFLLSSQFIKIIVIAICLALPFTLWGMHRWLTDFPYRVPFPWWVPLVVGLFIILLAFLTVSIHTFKAATINPVKALREE